MKYAKPALSFQEQAQLLVRRGLIAPDEETLAAKLSAVNYYRLSAYWYPFKQVDPATNEERFAPNTTFETIWMRYSFDRELRLLVMDAIERIEIAILRTRMVEQFTRRHGPFGYLEKSNFRPEFRGHAKLVREVSEAVRRSREEFVTRFQGKYRSEPHLPLWMAVEVMTFGHLYTLFLNLHHSEKKALARQFNVFPPVIESWLHTLNFTRNVCAHHARLWNREIPIRPRIPDERHNPEWYVPTRLDNRRVFAVLTLLQHLLPIIDVESNWSLRLGELLQGYPEIPVRDMGFPDNWRSSPIWT